MKKILIIAHRGGAGLEEGNTLKAFSQALALGVDFIELDIQTTIDKEVVVYHDLSFKDGTAIASLSRNQIQTKASKLGIAVPTLKEVIKLVNNKVGLNIEVKTKNTVFLLGPLLASCKPNKIIISSFIHDCYNEVKRYLPGIKFAPLIDYPLAKMKSIFAKRDVKLLIRNVMFVKEEDVKFLHKNKKRIFVWTVNDSEDIKRMIDYRVDGIITDFPERVKSLL